MRIVILFLVFLCSKSALALETKPYLTLAMAKTIADTCEAYATKKGWLKVNIAIYDDGRNLVLFRRQDGAFINSIEIAQLKARTSAGMPRTTRSVGELNYSKPGRPIGIEQVPGFILFPGGLPIVTADGNQIGGIGVSGATGDQDEECAQAGIDAIADMLK